MKRVPMGPAEQLQLECRIDDFSYQVSALHDRRLWFRLERESGPDVITDFFIGSLPESNAPDFLLQCYKQLGFEPQCEIVFRDILPSSESESDPSAYEKALAETRQMLARCGRHVLRHAGYSSVFDDLAMRRGKYDLFVRALPAASPELASGDCR